MLLMCNTCCEEAKANLIYMIYATCGNGSIPMPCCVCVQLCEVIPVTVVTVDTV